MSRLKRTTRPLKSLPVQPKEGYRWALVNQKTGKSASNNSWFLSLAAVAVTNQDHQGIASLFPQEKASKSLRKNRLSVKIKRSSGSRAAKREQATNMLPWLKLQYKQSLPEWRTFFKLEFSKWIVKRLNDPHSTEYKEATMRGYDQILDLKNAYRWWAVLIKKLQS